MTLDLSYNGQSSLEIGFSAYLFNLICDDIKDFETESLSKNIPNIVDAINSVRFNGCIKKIEKFITSQKTRQEVDRFQIYTYKKLNKKVV
jgi:hypothetical protein